jgi:Zn-dependent M28 family amino/carboxypeptidase
MPDRGGISEARVLVDTDVILPALSRNLIAKIPGRDDAQALILAAHLDSPNNPGAMDDGGGSAILLELAGVLDQTGFQPGITTYLVWFGSEELFLYGPSSFANRHQELLDRTVAMLQIDCLIRPPDGITGITDFYYWSYEHYGDASYPFGEFLQGQARRLESHPEDETS